jgi:hypothetical protein
MAMLSRRGFCHAAAAQLALAAMPRPAAALARPDPARFPVAAVLYDERFADAREFATALSATGATPFPIARGSGALWHRALGALLRRQGARVAGMTTASERMIAASQGREMGLRALFEGAHDGRASEGVAHRYRLRGAPASLIELTGSREPPSPGRLAKMLTHIQGNPQDWHELACLGPKRDDHPGYLTSWLIG